MNLPIQAVAFDAYGTLCYIAEPTHPFSHLLQQANMATSAAMRFCMTRQLALGDLIGGIGSFSSSELAALEEKVQHEVASVRLFPEVEETLDRLRDRGVKLGLVSNLAVPYAAPVHTLLGARIDEYVWSFEVGAIKPEPAIFEALCQRLTVPPNRVLMIGDSMRADVEGARSFGISALHLARDNRKHTPESIIQLTEILEWLNAH